VLFESLRSAFEREVEHKSPRNFTDMKKKGYEGRRGLTFFSVAQVGSLQNAVCLGRQAVVPTGKQRTRYGLRIPCDLSPRAEPVRG